MKQIKMKYPTVQQQQPQNYYMHSENNFHNSQAYSMSEHKPTNYHQHHNNSHGSTECPDNKDDNFNSTPCTHSGQDHDIAHIVDQVLSCIDQFNVEQPTTENSSGILPSHQIER